MKALWKGAVSAAAICAAAAVVDAVQQPGAATRREPQFENGDVRVWKSIIQPSQPLALHRHEHGRTIVVLKGGTLDVIDASGATKKQMNWESGTAGKEPIEVIVVELRNDQKK